MKKRVLQSGVIVAILFLLPLHLMAQKPTPRDSIWKRGGNVALLLQQVGLSNWAGGGEDALSFGLEANLFANRVTENSTWTNSFQGGYGLVRQGDQGTRKNNDLLILLSKYGTNLSKSLQGTMGLDFRTQFADGFLYDGRADGSDSLISTFMAPGYLQLYLGFTYAPAKFFNLTIAPVTGKFTIVSDDVLSELGAYGVDPGKNLRTEFGANLNALFEKEIFENVNLKSTLLLFSDYEKPEAVDVNFDLNLNFKVNKYLTTNFLFQLIYDEDIKILQDDGRTVPKTQMRNVLNVGIAYHFGDKPSE